jgi:hypothetical protein
MFQARCITLERRRIHRSFPERNGGLRPSCATRSRCELLRLARKPNPHAQPCDTSTRRANHQNPVHPLPQKHSTFVVGQISAIGSPRLTRSRGAARDRHERCGGMRWTRVKAEDERLNSRTAKSCGPDAPTLALTSRRRVRVSRRKVARKPGHLGEHEVSRKPLRRESRRAPVHLWSYPRAYFTARGPWVRSAPGFPRALCLEGRAAPST